MPTFEKREARRAKLSTNFAGIALILLCSAVAIFVVMSFVMVRDDGAPVGKKDIDVKVLPAPS